MASNLKAAQGVVTALRVAGRIKPEYEAHAELVEYLANQMDISESNASLAKEYRMALDRLIDMSSASLKDDDATSEHEHFVNEVRTEIRDSTDS